MWTGLVILYAIKNICDSWKEDKISTLTRILKKSIPVLRDDFKGFKISVEEVTANASNGNSQKNRTEEVCDWFA